MKRDPVAAFVDGRRFRLLVGGDLVDATDGATFETFNPTTGSLLTHAPAASPKDVDRAVLAAKVAQPAWRRLGVRGRREVFERFGVAIAARAEELAALDAVDAGNPIGAMSRDVAIALRTLKDWPALALALTSDVIPEAGTSGDLHFTLYEPYGVVARIIPFNHPAMFAISGVLPALIAGNAVVLKAAEQTPLSALVLGEIAAEVFPPGVLNVLTGGAQTGDALVTHPDVRRIAFTGSTATGRTIQRRAAETGVKHVSLELGGKNALIIFPDADLAASVAGAFDGMNITSCQGQSCGSTSRVLVHRSLYDGFLDGLRDRISRVRVGVAYDDETEMGPVVSASQRDRILAYVELGRAEGARLVTGGGPVDGVSAGGYFVAPTAFADVQMDMRIAQEEIFGPVVCVIPWDGYDEMLVAANGVEYGLSASVWTNDLHLALGTAQALEAGYVWINETAKHFWGTPFGGTKASGVGREESKDELISYYELKAVHAILRDPRTRLP